MAEKTLTVRLKGSRADDENVRLSDFVEALAAVRDVLTGIDHVLTKSEVPSTDYKIVGLHRGSAEVVIEAIPIDGASDNTMTVLDKFFVGLEQIREGSAPQEFDSILLEKFGRLARGYKKNIREMVFMRNGSHVAVGTTFQAQVTTIIGEDEISRGSISGMLERINLHLGANVFVIYPIVGPSKVACHFPPNLLENAIRSVNQYINVSGELRYKVRDKFPYAIEVDAIEPYPDEKELPTIFDLRGIAPNATGNLSPAQFIRKLRDAQD